MQKVIRQLYISAAIAGAALSPQVQAATLIDFEPAALTGLYFANDSFVQNGYKMTVDFDAGIVDTVAAFSYGAPTGNATQFYSQLNDGGLIVERDGGGLFSLNGFDAAFVPLDPAAAGLTVLVAVGVFEDGTRSGVAWLFGPSTNTHFPFSTYNNPGDFAAFSSVKLVEFFACAYDGVTICSGPTQNNGQFAIDNISVTAAVTAVPEPATVALFSLGLLGLALRSRRSAR